MNADKLYNTIAETIQIQPTPLFITNAEIWDKDDSIRNMNWETKPAENQTLDSRQVLSYTVCNIQTLKNSFCKEVATAGEKMFTKEGQLLIIGVREEN